MSILRYVPIPRIDPLTLRSANFAFRTMLASLLALYIALYLQLDEPHWAAVTVWVVGQPMRGMALLKSYYRFLGTVAGTVMAITLTAFFAQSGTLFIFYFACWIALCTMVATLLRNFKAYGAVLAGYTCGIIALNAYGKPDEIFDIAVARVTCIFLGIALEALVAAVFVKSTPQTALLARLRTICSDTAAFASAAINGDTQSDSDKAQRILRDIVILDAAVSYAAAEDQNIRRRAGVLRQVIVSVMTAVSAAEALGRHLAKHNQVPTVLQNRLQRASIALHNVTPENADKSVREISALYEEMQQTDWRRIELSDKPDAKVYFVSSRFSDMFGALASALQKTEDFFAGRSVSGRADISFHRDYNAARVNALRAFIAVISAGAFWYASGWSHGQNFTRLVAVVCALYATRDNPVIGSRNFFNGALVAGAAAGLCHIFILPGINGFPLLAMLLAPFMIAGGMLMVRPKTAGIATAFNIFFISLFGISNNARYPFEEFLNDLIPLICGVGISVIVFMVFFPLNLEKRRFNIQRSVLRDIAKLAQPHNRMQENRWCSRMADRLSLLSAIRPPGNNNSLMERIIAANEIGVQTIRLREISRNPEIPSICQQAMAQSLQALTWFPYLGLIPDVHTGSLFDFSLYISRLKHGSQMPDSHWLRQSLKQNARELDMYLTHTDNAELVTELKQELLQAIAAQREIAEIIEFHYMDEALSATPPSTDLAREINA
ncbi:FUSC family protein [Microvirga sp. W0021]|uniref:FUSC family protein n=1 Tax=Hohaiivirga grylli TaxID=3133970 RepID=A0ABV0BH80_9HYPH